MEVKKLTPAELEGLLPLVWDVFLEYEGVHRRTESGPSGTPSTARRISPRCALTARSTAEKPSASSPPAAGAAMWPCFS